VLFTVVPQARKSCADPGQLCTEATSPVATAKPNQRLILALMVARFSHAHHAIMVLAVRVAPTEALRHEWIWRDCSFHQPRRPAMYKFLSHVRRHASTSRMPVNAASRPSGRWLIATLVVSIALSAQLLQAQEVEYTPTVTEPLAAESDENGLAWKVLVDAVNLGSEETRIIELTFPAGYSTRSHTHNAVEIFYVLEGRFGHEVNGKPAVLEPGDIGIVRPGDLVVHSVDDDDPAVVLAIWVPGGAAAPFGWLLESEQ
jgi:quercetin dioxygenase-like cupin family protein